MHTDNAARATQATRLADLPEHLLTPTEQAVLDQRRTSEVALRQLDLIHQQHQRRTSRALSVLAGVMLLLTVITLAGLLYVASAPI